ncbi:MAG TPA: amidohydrolase family protein [Chitinophagaceae bacterium]|nr:amidohydrolase family protein [Chitinophagaceae bacterium]
MKMLLSYIAFMLFISTQAQTYAIIADRLIDGKSNEPHSNPVVIVHNNTIAEINFSGKIPDSAIVINLQGYALLPGMMDVHTHLLADGGDYEKDLYGRSPALRSLRAAKYLQIALDNGFTTLRDVCTEGAGFSDVDLKKAIDSSFIIGPRVFPSGRGISATGNYLPFPATQNWSIELPYGTQFATGHDECVKAVRDQVTHGVSWIKLFADWFYPTFDFDEMKAVVDEAKKYHVNVAAHATSKQGIRMAILAGARSIEHGDGFDDSLIQLALANHTFWVPTISVYEYFNYPLDSTYIFLNKAYRQHLKIVLGTDIGSYPWDNNEAKELEYYVRKAGFRPMDAIKTATLNAAELLGRQDKLSQVQKNFIADIIAVKGNPLDDITLLQHVAFVMKEGKVYKQPGNK